MAQGYKDFVAGTALAAADLEDFCELQSVMRFATAAARNTALSAIASEGMCAYLLDSNTLTIYSGSTWSTVGPVHGALTSYTPTWSGITLGTSTVVAEYGRVGRMVFFKVQLTLSGATVTTPVTFTLPVTGTEQLSFPAAYSDVSASYQFVGTAHMSSTTAVTLKALDTAHLTGYLKDVDITATVPVTWANGDIWRISGFYAAATDA